MADRKEGGNRPISWLAIGRILVKAAIIFIALNLVFTALRPLEGLGQLSLYNWLIPGRQRLPYGENAAESYNLSLNNIPAMMRSHEVSQPKTAGEYRVIVIGDSGAWGWLLENEDSLTGRINAGNYQTEDGRRVVAYNLGYPIMALSKDLLILDAAMAFEPDLILWPVTLESFPSDKQLLPPLVLENPERMRNITDKYDINLDPDHKDFVDPTFLEGTIIGQRRALADLLRLQIAGFSWWATGIDQAYPDDIPLRKSDFDEDLSWGDFDEPVQLTDNELAFDFLTTGATLVDEVPLLIVNEPVFVSEGENSDIRYNTWYPRWAYDQYRQLLARRAWEEGWNFLDLWDSIEADEFTDSPVHLTPSGITELVELIMPVIIRIANENN